MKLLALFLTAVVCFAQSRPQLTFSKSFPGSKPEYEEVRLAPSGEGDYREDPKEDSPKAFHLTATETEAIYTLAQKVGWFSKPLESGLKVANMGAKKFRSEGPQGAHEITFNYTDDADGKLLLDWFEKIGESERALLDLESAVRFDKLGVQKAILQVEIVRDNKRLVAAEQFLPMLDRIAKNEAFLHMARTRAANLADSIRAGLGQ